MFSSRSGRKPQGWQPERGKLIAWLLGITRYTAIDRLRKESRYIDDQALLEETHADESHDLAHPGSQTWRNGYVIRKLIDNLPVEQAEAVRLAFFQGLTHTQLADHLDLPLGTVKTRIRLGLQKLREMWLQEVESAP